jgi:nucleoside-diphosphate-sugar epimerase
MRRAFVTGGTGFVGANLVRRLLADGNEVHLLVRPGHQAWRLADLRSGIEIHETDLADGVALKRTLQDVRPDWIFHLAAYGAYSSQGDLSRMVATNVMGTTNLLEACSAVGFDAFVNAGSSSEYGFKDHPPAENEALDPNSFYAVTKASATMLCRQTARQLDLPVTTLRLYSVFGPWEEPTRLIPTLICYGLRGLFPPMAAPTVSRDFVFVDDATEAFILAARNPADEKGAVYNVGSGHQSSLEEVAKVAARVLSIPAAPEWKAMPNRNWDTDRWIADPAKATRLLGWSAAYDFEEGFVKTVEWLRNDPEMLRWYEQQRSLPV